MRPDLSSLRQAVAKGLRAAWQNLPAMSVLLGLMAAMVAIYYFWPDGSALLSRYGAWQHAGGIVRTGLVAGFAGGILSELSLVYVRDRGRWTLVHVENMAYRFLLFFVSGMIVSEFYTLQAYWFGAGLSWRVILPKVFVDQFIYSVFWSTTYYTLAFRWQVLRYSGSRLWSELDGSFVIERMLPVLVTNWMFWIPGVFLVYAMPLALQMPLTIFATAIWSVLLATISKQGHAGATPELVPAPAILPVNPPELFENRT